MYETSPQGILCAKALGYSQVAVVCVRLKEKIVSNLSKFIKEIIANLNITDVEKYMPFLEMRCRIS